MNWGLRGKAPNLYMSVIQRAIGFYLMNKVHAFRRMKRMVFQTAMQFRRLILYYLYPRLESRGYWLSTTLWLLIQSSEIQLSGHEYSAWFSEAVLNDDSVTNP